MNPYQQAKSQGYSDDEIVDYLSEHPEYREKISKAREEGYTSSQIGKYLKNQKVNPYKGLSDEKKIERAQEFGIIPGGKESKEFQSKVMGSVIGGLIGAPRSLLEFPGHLVEKLQTLVEGEPNRETWAPTGKSIIEGLESAASYLPSTEQIRGGTIATELKDNPELQEILKQRPELWEKVLAGISGGATLGGVGGAAIGAIQPGMEQVLEEVGAPERVKAAADIGLLAAGGLIHKKGLQGKTPSQKSAIRLMEKYGMSEAQMAPVLEKPGVAKKWLAKLASKDGKVEAVLESTGKGLGDIYETLKSEHPSSETVLDMPARNTMEIEINEKLESLPSQLRKAIESDVQEFYNSPRAASDIMNLYQDINDVYVPKKSKLQTLKEPLMKGLEQIDPELSSDFSTLNQIYGNYKSVRQIFKPNELGWLSQLSGGPGIVASYILGNPVGFVKGLGVKWLASKAAREMIINPKLKNISQRLAYGINKKSLGAIKIHLKELADEVEKSDPATADEIRNVDPQDLIAPSRTKQK